MKTETTYPTLFELAPKLAEHLDGWTWKTDEEGTWQHLDGANGTALILRHAGRGKFAERIEVSGSWPDGCWWSRLPEPYCSRSYSISMSRDKSPAKMAQEIKRRLLPHYIEGHAMARAKVKGERERENAALAGMKALADMAGGGGRLQNNPGGEPMCKLQFGEDMGGGWLDFRPASDGTVRTEYGYIPQELAEIIAKYAAERNPTP